MSRHVEAGVEQAILVSLCRIIRAVELYSRRLMDEHGLTGPQLATLREIARAGGLGGVELAEALQVSQPTITGIIDRLENRGLVVRSRNGRDRRTVQITVTEKGRQLADQAPPLLQERFCEELTKLQKWEQSMHLANLQRVAAMMNASNLDATPHLVSGPERL